MAMAMAFPSLPLPSPSRPFPPHCHRSPSRPLVCCQLFQRSNRRRLPGFLTKSVKLLASLARPNQVSDTGSKGDSRLEDPSPGNSSSSLLEPKLWPRLFKSLVRPKKNSHREGKGKDGLTDPVSGNGSSRGLERCTLRHTCKDRWRRPKWLLVWNSREVREIWALLLQLGVVLLFMRFTGLLALPTARTERRIGQTTEFSVSTSNIPFSEFLCRVQQGHVQSVEIDGVHFRYSLRFTQMPPELQAGSTDLESNVSREKYDYRVFLDQGGDLLALQPLCYDQVNTRSILYTTIKPYDMVTPYERMIKNGVDFRVPDKRATNFINSFGLPCLYVGLLATMSIQRFSSVLQSTAWPLMGRKFYKRGGNKEKEDSITFADVAGVDEAKEELEEVVDYLRNPQRYSRLGASPPRGILLVGPPGTGKTLLARAVSGEADVPFISCAGSEFVEMYVGMGASRVRELFAKAKEAAPSIIFIDEIDAVAKGRDGHMLGFASDEREQTLNQLLTELDGFERRSMVIVLAATNRADVLDPALRRPGRFDRVVMVDPPDKLGREKVLQVHVSKKQVPLSENVDLEMVAAATSGFTGADLANLVNEAALLAGRANKEKVFKEDFLCAVERAIGGIEKKRSMLHAKEKGVVARHEVGHAIVGAAIANLLPRHGRVQKLSILPRTGGALGFTYSPPASEDRYLMFVDELRGRLVTLLGGRAAEEVIYHGRVSTGALDDIRQATDMAYKAVAEYGLNSLIGPVSLATLSGGGLDSVRSAFPRAKGQGAVIDLVQTEVRLLLQSALSMALIVIRSNPTILEGLAAQLEANDKVEGESLQQWLNQVVAPDELSAFVKKGKHIIIPKAFEAGLG